MGEIPNASAGLQRSNTLGVGQVGGGGGNIGNAGLQRSSTQVVGKGRRGGGGGGDILRRGLPSRKPRPMSMPPQQSSAADGLKIQLPPHEY